MQVKDSEMIYRKDVFDLKPADARIEIQGMKESTQENKDKWRFIPNTGEYLMLSGIKFAGKNALGIELTGRSFEVNFCGAADRDYQAENTSGNIYKNTAGSFEVAFFGKNDMKVEEGIITQLPENKAVYEYSRKADGKDAVSFLVNTSGKLIYSEGTGGGAVKIGIRPISSAQAYPGDDLLLQFKIKNSNEKIQTDKKDYIAVYDKKMLWRANLYIDEGIEDWNNKHPWNTADTSINWYGENEWLVTGTEIAGGQCEINDWTRWNNGATETNSVAYGWGCWDEVKDFNNELENQSKAIGKYRDENPESEYASLQWINTQTTAPGTGEGTERWKNYIFQKDAAKDKNGQNKISEINADVSVPGLSTYWDEEPRNSYKAGTHDKWTSGIDCSGLASISAQYSDRIYTISNWQESKNISTTNLAGRRFNETTETYEEVSNPITYAIYDASKEGQWDIANTSNAYDKQRKLLSHAVPGDILVKTADHVVIIQNLNYPDDTMLITDFSQIDVIHSCKSLLDEDALWKVRKSTFNEVDSVTNISSYQLRRYSLRSE